MRDRFSAPHPNSYLDARTEPVDDRHKAIDGESPEVLVADSREVSRRNAGSAVRGAHSQAFPVECLNDFGGENRLELFSIGVLTPEIAEHIAATSHNFQFFAFH